MPACQPAGPAHVAPTGDLPAVFRDGLICVAGRHLCACRDGILRRTFDGSRELFRGGLAFRCDVLTLAREHGATVILATERTSGTIYRVGLADFMRRSWVYRHAVFGEQRGLALSEWRREAAGEPGQLSLWGRP